MGDFDEKDWFKLYGENFTDMDFIEELRESPRQAFASIGMRVPELIELILIEPDFNIACFVVPFNKIADDKRIETLSENPAIDEIYRYVITHVQAHSTIGDYLMKDLQGSLPAVRKDVVFKLYCNTETKLHVVLPFYSGEELTAEEEQAVVGAGAGDWSAFTHKLYELF